MINISIDVSKIDKSRITEGKNGAKYLNLTIDKLQTAGKFGETHTVYMRQSKEEYSAKEKKVYVGNGKEIVFGNKSTPQQIPPVPQNVPSSGTPIDDLPF